jgi:hypothetical protein
MPHARHCGKRLLAMGEKDAAAEGILTQIAMPREAGRHAA